MAAGAVTLDETTSGEESIDEAARRRFEVAWREGAPIAIETCVAADSAHYAATVEELVHIELELAWRRHRSGGPAPPQAETYLERFAFLRTPASARRILEQEHRCRQRFGGEADAAQLQARWAKLFPDLPAPSLGPPPDPAALEPVPGMPLGRYQLQHEHGRGGMGRVWAARDPQLDRTLAIKQLAPGLARDPHLKRRFLAEARLAARLDHPGVVPVYELVESATPYYAMRMVTGRTLTEVIVEAHSAVDAHVRRLGLRRALDAILAATRTIAFAHDRGILHRDLKPDNIIVGAYGETVIIDWGLAKHGDDADTSEPRRDNVADAVQTLHGSVIGTPAYMPPEQARGDIALVDARSDVYALGAVLYHALTGAPPYTGRPLDVIEEVKTTAPPPIAERAKDAPAELVTIAARAMARDRDARYASAAELADALARFEAGQLVPEHQYSLRELVARWLRKHRTAVITGTLLAIALAITAGIAVRQTIVGRERAQANLSRAVATLVEQGRSELLAGETGRAAVLLGEAVELGATGIVVTNLFADALAPLAARGTGAATGDTKANERAVIGPGGVELRDAAGALVRILPGPDLATPERVVASADGSRIAGVFSGTTVRVWSETGEVIATANVSASGLNPAITAIAIGARGNEVVVGTNEGDVLLAPIDSQLAFERLPGSPFQAIERIALSPGKPRRMIALANDRRIWIWGVGAVAILAGHRDVVRDAQFAPTGEFVTIGGTSAIVWDAATNRRRVTLEPTGRPLTALAIAADGTLHLTDSTGQHASYAPSVLGRPTASQASLAPAATTAQTLDDTITGSTTGTLTISEPRTGATRHVLDGHAGAVTGVAIEPTTRQAITGGDTTARIWDLRTGTLLAILDASRNVLGVALTRDHARVVTDDGQVLEWPRRHALPPPEVRRAVLDAVPWRIVDGRLVSRTE